MPSLFRNIFRKWIIDQRFVSDGMQFIGLKKKSTDEAQIKGEDRWRLGSNGQAAKTVKSKKCTKDRVWYYKTNGKYVKITHGKTLLHETPSNLNKDLLKSCMMVSGECKVQGKLLTTMHIQEVELKNQVKLLSDQVAKLTKIVSNLVDQKQIVADATISKSRDSFSSAESSVTLVVETAVVPKMSGGPRPLSSSASVPMYRQPVVKQMSGGPPPPPPPPSSASVPMYRQPVVKQKAPEQKPFHSVASNDMMEQIRSKSRPKLTLEELRRR